MVSGYREIPRRVREIAGSFLKGVTAMKRLLGLFFLSLLASGCATTGDVTAFKDANDTSNIQESEGRLWHEARGYDATIERSGQIYEDPRATAYLQGVMDRLYPEFKGKIHVHLYDST